MGNQYKPSLQMRINESDLETALRKLEKLEFYDNCSISRWSDSANHGKLNYNGNKYNWIHFSEGNNSKGSYKPGLVVESSPKNTTYYLEDLMPHRQNFEKLKDKINSSVNADVEIYVTVKII